LPGSKISSGGISFLSQFTRQVEETVMYRVDWRAVDEDMLNYWLLAPSSLRRAITEACNRLDRQLSRHPELGIASEDPDFLFLDDHPVRVYYQIDSSRQEVVVSAMTILTSK
jgi:hypothetical protein